MSPKSNPPERSRKGTDGYERLAKGLGWFSIGLGAAELFAAGPVARFIGVRDSGRNPQFTELGGVRPLRGIDPAIAEFMTPTRGMASEERSAPRGGRIHPASPRQRQIL